MTSYKEWFFSGLIGLSIGLAWISFGLWQENQTLSQQQTNNRVSPTQLKRNETSEPLQQASITINQPKIQQPQKTTTPLSSISSPLSYADAVERAAPAVVNIYTTQDVQPPAAMQDPGFKDFFGQGGMPSSKKIMGSLGSGIIIQSSGYIMTSYHVIREASDIFISLQDGREASATVAGLDPETDLALLKIDIGTIPSITMAPSSEARTGDVVLAIGNPFGVGQTVTMGVISAKGRNRLALTTYEDYIQTDAAINPGSSGGALINAQGDMIGLNAAIFSKSGGHQGIGFAVPTHIVQNVYQQLLLHGRVIRGWLGIVPVYNQSRKQGIKGVVIAAVIEGSPAHGSNLFSDDRITHINRQPIEDQQDAMNMIAEIPPGSPIALRVMRGEKVVRVRLFAAERPAL